MTQDDWKVVSREHVLTAIEEFDALKDDFPAAKSTFLPYNGKSYPAKHIRGMAYKAATGRELRKQDYAGGMGTVRFFLKRGFDINYHGQLLRGDAAQEVAQSIPSRKKASAAPAPPPTVKTPSEASQQRPPSMPREPLAQSDVGDSLIRVPQKGVIEQKNALQLLLNRLYDGDVVCEKTFDWMKTPSVIDGYYARVRDALQDYRGDTEFAKKGVSLRCDFVVESQQLIIEYDERQHFSKAREAALCAYSEQPLDYDRDRWIAACQKINAKDNSPKNRDEIRAYYDSVRDIAAYENEYHLIRIMHGQEDFTSDDALEYLKSLLPPSLRSKTDEPIPFQQPLKPEPAIVYPARGKAQGLKVALYIQTDEVRDLLHFNAAMRRAKHADADILVFPETCYTPFIKKFQRADMGNADDVADMYDRCLSLSRSIGKAVIVNSDDRYGTIFSIYANAFARENETTSAHYVKHTMTGFSAFDFDNYRELASEYFTPVRLKGHKIGMTICYDCNHPMFSRMHALNGADILINSTGGDVVYDKWYKYNQVRSIETGCFSFVAMGGFGKVEHPHCYAMGFSPTGKEMSPIACLGADDTPLHNTGGAIYLYDTGLDDGSVGVDKRLDQKTSTNKRSQFEIQASTPSSVLKSAKLVENGIYVLPYGSESIVFCVVEGEDIFKPEAFLPLLYSDTLKQYRNKRYIILNQWAALDDGLFRSKLSATLKVRAMENYCAVILTSDSGSLCYQCGQNRTAQVVAPLNGVFGIDLKRAGGPDSIWEDKRGMKRQWRNNVEWLISQMAAKQ